eukprot:gene4952-biopygen13095
MRAGQSITLPVPVISSWARRAGRFVRSAMALWRTNGVIWSPASWTPTSGVPAVSPRRAAHGAAVRTSCDLRMGRMHWHAVAIKEERITPAQRRQSTRARPLKLRGWGYPPSRRPGRMDPAGRVYLMDPPGRGVPTPTPPPPAGLADPPVLQRCKIRTWGMQRRRRHQGEKIRGMDSCMERCTLCWVVRHVDSVQCRYFAHCVGYMAWA